MGALRDIKRDMAERRAALQKLIVQEVEARIFSSGEPAAEAGAAAAAASQKAHQRSALPLTKEKSRSPVVVHCAKWCCDMVHDVQLI